MRLTLLCCGLLLLLLLIVKGATVLQTAVWLWRHGEEYGRRINALGGIADAPAEEVGKIVIALNGHRGPMGIYPAPFWRDAILPLLPHRPVMHRLQAWMRTALSLWMLIPGAGLAINLGLCIPRFGILGELINYVGFACAITITVTMVVSIVLTFISNALIGDLALFQVGFERRFVNPLQVAKGWMASLFGSGIVSWFAAASSVAFTSAAIGGFGRFQVAPDLTIYGVLQRLANSVYFVALAAFGVIEIDANTWPAKTLALLIILLALGLLAVLLGGMLMGVTEDSAASVDKVLSALDSDSHRDSATAPTEIRSDRSGPSRDTNPLLRPSADWLAAAIVGAAIGAIIHNVFRRRP
jgi:hypothetical protein